MPNMLNLSLACFPGHPSAVSSGRCWRSLGICRAELGGSRGEHQVSFSARLELQEF